MKKFLFIIGPFISIGFSSKSIAAANRASLEEAMAWGGTPEQRARIEEALIFIGGGNFHEFESHLDPDSYVANLFNAMEYCYWSCKNKLIRQTSKANQYI